MALQSLTHLLKRTIPTSRNAARLFAENTISSHPNIRNFAQKFVAIDSIKVPVTHTHLIEEHQNCCISLRCGLTRRTIYLCG